MNSPPWDIYAKQMFHHGYGYALWVPDPAPGAPSVEIGDVGWRAEGAFHPLFNSMKQPDEIQPRGEVPLDYVPFPKDKAIIDGPRMKISQSVLCGRSLHCLDGAAGLSAGGVNTNPSARINLQFTCTDNYGAALMLAPSGVSQTIMSRNLIARYMRTHFERWLELANSRFEIGLKDEELIFVCGTTKTSRWGVAAFHGDYREKSGSIMANMGSLASVEFALRVADAKFQSSYFRSGPPTYPSGTNWAPVTSEATERPAQHTETLDQCIFMHYYKMKRRLLLPDFPLQAAAGSWDPSTDNHGDHGSGPCTYISVTDETDDIYEGKECAPEAYDPVNALLNYILQHSVAQFAIASDLDLYALFEEHGIPCDISSELVQLAPAVVIDECGVGAILHKGHHASTALCDRGSFTRSDAVVDTANLPHELISVPNSSMQTYRLPTYRLELVALHQQSGPKLNPSPGRALAARKLDFSLPLAFLSSSGGRQHPFPLSSSKHHHYQWAPSASLASGPFPSGSRHPALGLDVPPMTAHTTAQSSGTYNNATRTILAGRKCYRMPRDKNEVVWPPHLEAKLIEGLERYPPAKSTSPRRSIRFSSRNKYIAAYIFRETGELRTAKQVGSRIQQLRDCSAGKKVMQSISDRHYDMLHPKVQGSSVCARSPPTISKELVPAPSDRIVHVYITVPPDEASVAHTTPALVTESPSTRTKSTMSSSSTYKWTEPRSLRDVSSSVTFKALSPLPLHSRCSVYRGDTMLHSDCPVVMGCIPEERGDSYLHSTSLAPGYWDALCNCNDLSPYTIIQEISKEVKDPSQRPTTVMIVQYHFSVTPHRPLSPFTVKDEDVKMEQDMDDVASLLEDTMSISSDMPDLKLSGGSSSPTTSVPGWASQPPSPVAWSSNLPESSNQSYDASGPKQALEHIPPPPITNAPPWTFELTHAL